MINLIIRILKCLDKNSISRLVYLQIFSVLVSLFNILSAIIIAPFVLLLSGSNLTTNNLFFKKIFNFLNFFPYEKLLIYVSLMFTVLYLLTIFLTLVLNYFNLKWTQDISIFFQKNLYQHFINKNLLFHSRNSSKDLVSKIHTDTHRLSNTVVLPFIDLFSSLIIALGIMITIFFVDFNVAFISSLIVFGFYAFFFYYFKKKLRKTGDTITKTYPLYYRSLIEGFSSIKDIILFNKKDFFINKFKDSLTILRSMNISQSFLLQVPRSLIEMLFFIMLISFILVLSKIYQYEFIEISALIAFYGICSLKLLPAVQKVFRAISTINANQSSFFNLEQDLLDNKIITNNDNVNIELKNEVEFKNFITLENISFNYPNNKKAGVFDVNMKIPYGSKIGIVGKTGSGKSTLINLILGFISAQKGKIEVDQVNIDNTNIKSWQKKLSYVPQNFSIYEGTIGSNIAFGLEENLIDDNLINKSMNIAELSEFINDKNRIVGEDGKMLSGGQKQRVGIARAIYKNSEVLVLDEATNALDTITEIKIIKNLKKEIKTLIIVSHRFETLKICDFFYFLDKGKVHKIENFEKLTTIYKDS